MTNRGLGTLAVIAATLISVPAVAQTAIVPLNTLIGTNGTLTAGPVTFSNFQIPLTLPANMLGVRLPTEFADIGVSATANADGTASLAFIAIDSATGLPSPIVVSPTGMGEFARQISYTFTVTNPALRVHSVEEKFGPGSTMNAPPSEIFGLLYAVEPAFNLFDVLIFDAGFSSTQMGRIARMPSADGSGSFLGTGGILMPGGNLSTYTMATEIGVAKGHLGSPSDGQVDSLTLTFSLVPVGSPVPPVTPDFLPLVSGSFFVDSNGIGVIFLTDYAQDGGEPVGLASSNPAAVTLPSPTTILQGYKVAAFQPVPTVDAPTDVTLTALLPNGNSRTYPYTVNPATPLALSSIAAGTRNLSGFIFSPEVTTAGATLLFTLNRENFSPATIQLTSSNPALAPVPATFTIPALTPPGDFNFINVITLFVPFQTVAVNTPVTFTAAFNGSTQSVNVIIPKTVDVVAISKAELVVKNGSLKVEASSNKPAAVLTLYNNATGQLIGTMTNTGLSGGGAKYSFQGTVSPVTTLRLQSTLGGISTGAVSQK